MSIFEDKVYQDMDWLEKVCEPIVCNLNDILNQLPDTINIDYGTIINYACNSYGPSSMSASSIIEIRPELKPLSYSDKKRVIACFDLTSEGEPTLDLEKRTLTGGTVSVVKIKQVFDEKEIRELIGAEGYDNHLRNINHDDTTTERLNEILELLGMHEARRNRSSRQKMDAFKERMREIMKNNEWDIRDVALSNRVQLWLRKYLIDGSLAAYTNFCKLKVMTHYDAPIYSVEGEEQV